MNINTVQKFVEGRFVELMASMFDKIDFGGRFTVESGMEVVTAGVTEKRFSVYFDDQFIFSFVDSDHPITVDRMFLDGFLAAYQEGKIYVNQGTYEEVLAEERRQKLMKDEAEKAQRRKDLAPLSADEKAIADKVLTDVKG